MPLQVSELRNKALRFAVQRGLRFDGRDIIGISGKKLKITFNEEYPSINFIMNGKLYHLRVHRIKAYILYGEELFKKGVQVRHLNGDKKDYSDENIAIGNSRDNHLDIPKVKRLEISRKAATSQRKFTDKDIKNIISQYDSKEFTMPELAVMYQVSKSTIFYILKRITYKDMHP